MAKYEKYAEYKDSGVEWLGKVPNHWGIEYSKWLFEERNTKATAQDEMLTASQKYGVIPQKLFMELEQQKVVQVFSGHDILKKAEANDFVISMRSFQGGIEFSEYSGAVSSAYVPLEPRKDLSLSYYKYLFKSVPYIQALQTTTNLVRDGQALRYGNFIQVRIPLVPFHEAEKISNFLDHETAQIDSLITKQEKLIELLKEKRQAVISHAVTKGLNPNVPMKDSGVEWLGEIPSCWKPIRLKHLILDNLVYGANEAAEDDNPNNPRYIRITDMNSDGSLDPNTFRSLPYHIAQSYLLQEGDILLARSGATVGKSFLFKSEFGTSCFAGYLIRARSNKSKLNPKFAYWFFQSESYWTYVSGSQIQATIQNVSAEKYGDLYLSVPEIHDQGQIVNFLDHETAKIDTLISKAQSAIQLMQERRTALISAAVTGKIDVRHWQNPDKNNAADMELSA